MIRGETVFVKRRLEDDAEDSQGNSEPSHEEYGTAIEDVLVAPGATSDIVDSIRPDGKQIAFTLYFPKSYEHDLTSALIYVRDEKFTVVGSPRPWCPDMTPGKWNLVVGVVKTDG